MLRSCPEVERIWVSSFSWIAQHKDLLWGCVLRHHALGSRVQHLENTVQAKHVISHVLVHYTGGATRSRQTTHNHTLEMLVNSAQQKMISF